MASSSSSSSVGYHNRQEVLDKLLFSVQRDASGSSVVSDDDNNVDVNALRLVSSAGRDRQALFGGAPSATAFNRNRCWTDEHHFFQETLDEVYEKLTKLEKQIWGKLIVMEGNCRTAKAYLRHPLITVDSSATEFDGLRIGLSRFENVQRTAVVEEIFEEIRQGIKIKADQEGNIWAKRLCQSPVFLKPLYRNQPNDLFVLDQHPVKVFDIERFKEILVLELKQPEPNRRKLEKCCLICLKFCVGHVDLLSTPCWILLIHLIAIELLNMALPRDREISSPSDSFMGGEMLAPYQQRQQHKDKGGAFKRIFSSSRRDEHHRVSNHNYANRQNSPPLMTANGNFLLKRRPNQQDQFHQVLPMMQQPWTAVHQTNNTKSGQDLFTFLQSAKSNNYSPSAMQYGEGVSAEANHRRRQSNSEDIKTNKSNGPVASSMVDLRQINRYNSPVYFDRRNDRRQSRGGVGHMRSAAATRVFSFEDLHYGQTAQQQQPLTGRNIPSRMSFNQNPVVGSGQNRLQKWKSQDSGIGTNGSFGSNI